MVLGKKSARGPGFAARAGALAVNTGASAGTPVIPVIVGESLRAARLSALLFQAGINVQPMVAPSVPDDQARVRFFVAATHTEDELRTAVHAVERALRSMTVSVDPASAEPEGVVTA